MTNHEHQPKLSLTADETLAGTPLHAKVEKASEPAIWIDFYPNIAQPVPLSIGIPDLIHPEELAGPIVLDEIGIRIKGLRGGDLKGVLQARTGKNPQEFPPYIYPAGKPIYHLDTDEKTGLYILRIFPVSISATLTTVSGVTLFGRDMSTGTVQPEKTTNHNVSFHLEYDNNTYIGASTFTPQNLLHEDSTRGTLELHRWFNPKTGRAEAMQIPSEVFNLFAPRALFTVVVADNLLEESQQKSE